MAGALRQGGDEGKNLSEISAASREIYLACARKLRCECAFGGRITEIFSVALGVWACAEQYQFYYCGFEVVLKKRRSARYHRQTVRRCHCPSARQGECGFLFYDRRAEENRELHSRSRKAVFVRRILFRLFAVLCFLRSN